MVEKVVEEIADHIDQRLSIFLAREVKVIRYIVRPNQMFQVSIAIQAGRTAQGIIQESRNQIFPRNLL